ncbi:MAG: hypothetical protein QM770_02490 [Tepidisphaeraceae bacterium]
MSTTARWIGCVACLTFSACAHAATLVSEPFNYTLNVAIAGRNGGSGFFAGDAWSYTEQGAGGSTSTGTIAPGLTFSDLPVSGNSALLSVVSSSSSGFSDTVNIRRRPAVVPNGTTDEFWTRYLFRESVNRANVDLFVAGLTIDDVETVSLYHKFGTWAISGNANDHGGVNVDTSVTAAISATNSLSDSNTYLLIGKFTNVNAGFTVARTGKFWALSVADYDAIKPGGITEAELDATHSQTATETVLPTVSQPLNFTTSDFYNFRGVRPAVSNAFESYYFDELVSGTTLGDLGLPTPPAPEPASAAVTLGTLFTLRRVRTSPKHASGR